MSTSLLVTVFAVACLTASTYLARRHLHVRRGLRRVFLGLFCAAMAGVAVTTSSSLGVARLLSVPMLAGIGLVISGIHFKRTKGQDAA